MNSGNAIPLMLLAMPLLALGIGFFMLGWLAALHRRTPAAKFPSLQNFFPVPQRATPARPDAWLAIRSVSPEAVKLALGLNRATPCSWAEGIAGAHEFFISPRVHGWVIVTGVGLPNPSDDVDGCFLFLTAMSRQLGHIQYFTPTACSSIMAGRASTTAWSRAAMPGPAKPSGTKASRPSPKSPPV